MAKVEKANANATTKDANESDQKQSQETPPDKVNTEFSDKQGQRRIGRWFIGETLGKGGYSWVKKGVDRKNSRIVALKFMERRVTPDGEWKKTQQLQIKNEIEALKMLRHNHIVRLLAYNLNAKYPDRHGRNRDVILLVLEYAAGGELFDILYYTQKLEPILARTYFRQLVTAIEFMHSRGIIHRDIKPQNLLLDQNYNLKITDFGLSKIDPSGSSDALMDDYHVATRGYQAPEILLRKKYTKAVDIFAMGVVLFILLGGYPPFEHAKETDKWYQFIVKEKYKNFWKSHRNCGLKQKETDLITKMIWFNPEQRIDIPKIKKHSWFKSKEILSGAQLVKVLRYRHSKMEVTRNNDPNKQQILQHSEKRRAINPNFVLAIKAAGLKENSRPPVLPSNEIINPKDIYSEEPAFEILQGIQKIVQGEFRGDVIPSSFNQVFESDGLAGDDTTLQESSADGSSAEQKDSASGKEAVVIDICNFSLTFKVAIQDLDNIDDGLGAVYAHAQVWWVEEFKCNLVKFTKLKGSSEQFEIVLKKLGEKAGFCLTGLGEKTRKALGDVDADQEFQELYAKCFPKIADEAQAKMLNN